MNEKKRHPRWVRIKTCLVRLRHGLVLYLEDLLLLGGGCCFVRAAWEALGRPAGLAVAGLCLCIFALPISRAKRGGGN